MNGSRFRAVAETIAVLSVVMSLIFVGYEMRLNRAVAIAENFSNASERVMTFRQALVDNAEVWRKGCLGEEMTATERVQFFNLVEMWNFRSFANWRNANEGTGQRDPTGFAQDVARNLHRFPALRDAFLLNAGINVDDRGAGAWTNAVTAEYEQMAAEGAPQYVDVAHCGR